MAMSDVECEKIIDQAVESGKTDAAEAHAKTCSKCASTLALLALLKTSGSPTTDLKPSTTFVSQIEKTLTTSATGAGTAAILKSKLLIAAIGVALSAAVALTVLSRSKPADEHNSKPLVSSTEGQTTSLSGPERSNASAIKSGAEDAAFPQLQFPAPTDEIK